MPQFNRKKKTLFLLKTENMVKNYSYLLYFQPLNLLDSYHEIQQNLKKISKISETHQNQDIVLFMNKNTILNRFNHFNQESFKGFHNFIASKDLKELLNLYKNLSKTQSILFLGLKLNNSFYSAAELKYVVNLQKKGDILLNSYNNFILALNSSSSNFITSSNYLHDLTK